MSQFRFRLGKVLEWYEERCALEESRLLNQLEQLREIRTDIEEIECAVANAAREVAEMRSPTAMELLALARYSHRATQDLTHLRGDLEKLQTVVRKQTEVLQQHRRQVRLLERLRDRRFSEHNYNVNRELEELAADAFRSASFRNQRNQCT